MNKKANIPIIILVIGTLAVCIIALMAFGNTREGRNSKIEAFKELRIMYNVQNDMEFTGKDLDYVQEELYPPTPFYKGGSRNYNPVVSKIQEKIIAGESYLVIEEENYELRVPVK